MPKTELLGRLRGRRKAKVLVDNKWSASSDFDTLCNKLYQHIIRTDASSSNGILTVDVRKYLNWWKMRTYGKNVEFSNLPITLSEREKEAAVCLLLDAASIKYDLIKHNEQQIAVLQPDEFRSLMLWNVKIDPYESLKCFNETAQSSDFREHDDKKISFISMPRSHLPEMPDAGAQVVIAKWRVDLIDTLKRERLDRLTSSRTRRCSPELPAHRSSTVSSRNESNSVPRLNERNNRPPPSRRTTAPTASRPKLVSTPTPSPSTSKQTLQTSSSTTSVSSVEPTTCVSPPSEPRIVEVAEEVPPPDNTWRNIAWTIGSKVLYEALAALGREHAVRTEERQLNMRLAAAAAQQNQQLWTSVASWGAWSAHTALQYYFGSTGSQGSNLVGNG